MHCIHSVRVRGVIFFPAKKATQIVGNSFVFSEDRKTLRKAGQLLRKRATHRVKFGVIIGLS